MSFDKAKGSVISVLKMTNLQNGFLMEELFPSRILGAEVCQPLSHGWDVIDPGMGGKIAEVHILRPSPFLVGNDPDLLGDA